MKGIVFTEFVEMVEGAFGLDTADDLLEGTELASGGVYTAVGTYAFEELVALVVGLSERTSAAVPELLHAFGLHLFGRFVVAYPQFFAEAGGALDFLERIEGYIHPEVLKLYPDAELPRFETRRDGSGLEMVYRSPRRLGDFAAGLVQGCLAHFGEERPIEREDRPDGSVRFLIRAPVVSGQA